jgi:uncharacterized protein YeaO (DUF488 family)
MIRVVRLGTPRHRDEGLRLGTVRRPPRGVPKKDCASRDFYDVWVPELAPSPKLFAWIKARSMTDANWRTCARRYVAEMRRPEPRRLIDLLAALSLSSSFSVGCYCENERRCHRSLLRDLLEKAGARLAYV